MKTTTTCHHNFTHAEREAKVEVCLLGNVCNCFAFEVMAIFAMHHDITLVINESGKGFKQGGLAGAVGADDRYELASANGK
jgi:hypothetical protein